MLAAGVTLGPYRILAPLGAGGMGEVYRAHDSRLGRDVAIKVLPPRSAFSPDARARFEREARTISQLSHPHICALHDIGREGETDYLVMELLEGETLAHRLSRGPLPVADVLKLGAEIASALDRAHAAGVVHRDLKPGNVMLTKSGAKLMDFGLARVGAAPASGSDSALSASPTVTQPLTSEGAIVGTFQYMAPEQLEGKDADARSDIWALGCVLYEMATGKRAFAGESQASLIGAIMRDEPRPISELQPLTPPALGHVVTRCLAKDPAERWQSARDVASELRWAGESRMQSSVQALPSPPGPRVRGVRWLPWALTALLAITAGLQATSAHFGRHIQAVPAASLEIRLPAGLQLAEVPALSPDGRWLVFAATDSSGAVRLWLRPMHGNELRPLPGTESDKTALMPFWSPDSRNIAFFASGKLKRLAIDGTSPVVICDAGEGRGGSWSRNGVIVFAPGIKSPIFRVPAAGGSPVAVTQIDSSRATGDRYPYFLPDGRHFLYAKFAVDAANPRDQFVAQTWWADLDGSVPRHVLDAESSAQFAAPGLLVYKREGALMAHPFDFRLGRVSGSPWPLASASVVSPLQLTGAPTFSVSERGLLAIEVGQIVRDRLYWFDRSGRPAGWVAGLLPRGLGALVSPDAARALYAIDAPMGTRLWLVDLKSGLGSSLAYGPVGWNGAAWSRDGRRVYYQTSEHGIREIRALTLDNAEGDQRLFVPAANSDTAACMLDCTPDGAGFIAVATEPSGRQGLRLLPATASGHGRPILSGPFNVSGVVALSPDGRWLAFDSDETGHSELYVTSFPVPGVRARVSTEGCASGLLVLVACGWTRDGRELIFLAPDARVMAASISTAGGLRVGAPRELFRLPPETHALSWTSDGNRFLLALPGEPAPPQHFTVLVNWQNAEAK